MSDPELLSGRALRQRMMRLDPEVRRRVDRAARRGERATSPEEARLVVSVARANRKLLPLLIALPLALIGLRLVAIVYRGIEVYDVALFVVVALALVKFAVWDPPRLRRAELLNRELLEGR